ncbi:MAG: hypothetical protein JSS66_06290 [Armatimonadetes bacterium]|nr:hypothetical protein [Armatimonadota bacterium]
MRIEQDEIERFLDLAYAFRSTEIVDDDFPEMRHRFDSEMMRLRQKVQDVKKWQAEQTDLDVREQRGEFGKW